jgi:hypothetical protein
VKELQRKGGGGTAETGQVGAGAAAIGTTA